MTQCENDRDGYNKPGGPPVNHLPLAGAVDLTNQDAGKAET